MAVYQRITSNVEHPQQRLALICIDASEHSLRAFEFYYYNVHHEGDAVGLVHIHTVPDAPSLGLFGGGRAALKVYLSNVEDSVDSSKAVIEKFKHLCSEKGINPKTFVQSMQDSIGHSICQIAMKEKATHIIIGQRGLGMFRRNLLGSVSDYVIHHSNIPVTIVTNPKNLK
ncbi:universal stress protein YxiE-like [Hydractinia symbiolongicarpus]|uniref:universal stress protein YxiE-like n=1 Tax=Hydractinia symbiolongicarpus TaxID=13093 RepID=UPI002550A06F|nr:universal stress protein YxiE-like [Hydractinia symbiolongicarpus]